MKNSVRPMRLTATVLALLAPMAFLSGCNKEAPKQGGARKMPPAQITVVTAEAKDHELTSVLQGRTEAAVSAEVRPQVNGLLKKRLFKEGDRVQAGQPLYEIDDAQYKAQLLSAKAQLLSARAQLTKATNDARRSQRLLAAKAVSAQANDAAQAQLEAAKAQVEAALAQVETAQINMQYTKVLSPVSGIAGRSSVTEGALLTAYQGPALVTVEQLDPMYVRLNQPVRAVLDLDALRSTGALKTDPQAMRVTITLPDGTQYSETGLMDFAGKTVDLGTGTVNRRATVANPKAELLPGMFVTATVVEGIRPNSIALPKQCVMHDPKGNAYVWVVDEKSAVTVRPVVVESSLGTDWLLSSGVKSGEKVVFEGFQRTRPGATVSATERGQKPVMPEIDPKTGKPVEKR